MNVKDREKFIKWYNERCEEGYVFNFQEEIVKYCREDVNILRLACLAFRKTFLEFGVDPFNECTTIASSCMRVFRKKFFKKYQIGVIPSGGYRLADNQSVKAILWLYWMEKRVLNRAIQHAGRYREKRLPEGILVDGYCSPEDEENHKGIVLQFHGCFWHGCPRCYRINRDNELVSGASMDDRYEKTCAISEKIKNSNYELIEIWECDYDSELSRNDEMRHFIENNADLVREKPLNPRDAFFGGRTGNTVKIYDCKPHEKIKYVDVCSLYPYICKYGKYPVGHPKIYIGQVECQQLVGDNSDISRVDGLVLCDVLPPRNLYHPVLPVKMHDKLIFPLCRTCCETMVQGDCTHEEQKDRVLHGTWVSEELKRAVELGYKIFKIYEIWQYQITQYNKDTRKGGIFAGYIDEFFKQKTIASGFPPDCTTDTDKAKYVKDFEAFEGIRLDKNSISLNPGLRSVAKLCLNSLWGKFGQRENMTQTEVVTEPKRLMDLLTSAEIDVNTVLPVNDETLYVNWNYKSEAVLPFPASSVVIAAFTTAQARLKLYDYLNILGSRALYYDTDSVIYVSRGERGEKELPIGSMLGELTDELVEKGIGTYITSFLSGGPKFYGYKYKKPDGNEECV